MTVMINGERLAPGSPQMSVKSLGADFSCKSKVAPNPVSCSGTYRIVVGFELFCLAVSAGIASFLISAVIGGAF